MEGGEIMIKVQMNTTIMMPDEGLTEFMSKIGEEFPEHIEGLRRYGKLDMTDETESFSIRLERIKDENN
jgi:hypothetical protein